MPCVLRVLRWAGAAIRSGLPGAATPVYCVPHCVQAHAPGPCRQRPSHGVGDAWCASATAFYTGALLGAVPAACRHGAGHGSSMAGLQAAPRPTPCLAGIRIPCAIAVLKVHSHRQSARRVHCDGYGGSFACGSWFRCGCRRAGTN